MKGAHNRALHRFAVLTASCTFLLVIAGALVTSNDAGLAVPDWPLSYGSLMPPMVGGIFWEHGHRMIAASVGLLTVVLAVWLWRSEPRRWVRRLGFTALGLVILQGVLGGITVRFFLPAPVSVAHATLAQLFFCFAVSLALVTGGWWQSELPQRVDSESPRVRTLAVLTLAAIFLQLVLGAAFRHNALSILPHAVWAFGVVLLAGWTSRALRTRYADIPALRQTGALLSALVGLQLLLGGATYWVVVATRDLPPPVPLRVWITASHVAVGALAMASSVLLALCCFRFVRPAGALERASGTQEVSA